MCSPTQKFSEPPTLGIFMEASSCGRDPSLSPFPALLPSLWKLRLKIPSFWIFSKSPHSRSQSSSTVPPRSRITFSEPKTLYDPWNSKEFRNSVSGTRVKDQIFEQTVLQVLSSLRILQVLLGALCQGAGAETNRYVLCYLITLKFILNNVCLLWSVWDNSRNYSAWCDGVWDGVSHLFWAKAS